jgi:ATP-binding cassette, subfamily B, multidrug efflux pump
VSRARPSGGAWSGDLEREASLGKAYDARLIGRLWGYVRPYKFQFWLAMVCLPLSSACALSQPYLLKLAIDRAMAAGDVAVLMRIAFLYALAMTAEFALLYLQYYLTMVVAQHSLADLRRDLITHVQRLPAEFFDRNPVGRLVTRLTSDVDVVNEMFAAGGLTILMDLVTLAGIVAIMLTIDFQLALVTLLVCPILALAINFFRLRARQNYRLIRDRLARLNAYLQEALAGMTVVQLFAREPAAWARFDRLNDDHRRSNHAANVYEASLFSLVESVSAISFALIVWYGGSQILAGALAFGTLVAFFEYIQKFFVPIRDFSTKYAVMQSAMSSAERIFQLLDTPARIESPPRPARIDPVRGRIEFDGVWFAYQGEDWVLRDVSFVVEAGEKVAFVGPTGSGKTTTIKLLNRSYDVQRGRVLVDGVDVREWDLSLLRRHIGVVLQDVFLFTGTIASNLTLERDDVTLEAAVEAARVVHADRFIRRLPAGYQERVRERGNNLSAGQRQLLAFARALAYRPGILVLDEATSSVDTETELLIQDALEKLLRDRTAVVIAHRLSTIERADRIMVMLGGEIRERGTHAELLRRRGLYFKLYELQYAQGQASAAALETSAAVQDP